MAVRCGSPRLRSSARWIWPAIVPFLGGGVWGGVLARVWGGRDGGAAAETAVTLYFTAVLQYPRRLRRINAETQRFAEERRERGRKALFSSAFLRALCVSALRLI